jgi:tetratricopeptide (TPR) repeat protein
MNNRSHLKTLILSAAALLIVAPVFAQGQQSQQGTQQQTNPPQQTQKPSLANPQQNAAAPPPVDPKEEAAYKAFYDMKPSSAADYQNEIQTGEKFLTDYPQSRYSEAVYGRLTDAYFNTKQIEKMCDAADKALAINPDDVSLLTQVGWMIPHASPTTPNYDQELAKAEQYEKHSLELLNAMNKPATMSQDQFDQSKKAAESQAHSGLGLVYFREKKYELSSAEMAEATTVAADSDPTDYLILGVDDETLQKYADAVKAYDTCAQIPWAFQERCKQGSAEAKSKEGAAPPNKP